MDRRGKNMKKLRLLMDLLIEEKTLPADYKGHALRGDFSGYRDSHIEPDWILIYTLSANHVRFERTGTHSDLFG
jgi:mRNA interferase YafQ